MMNTKQTTVTHRNTVAGATAARINALVAYRPSVLVDGREVMEAVATSAGIVLLVPTQGMDYPRVEVGAEYAVTA